MRIGFPGKLAAGSCASASFANEVANEAANRTKASARLLMSLGLHARGLDDLFPAADVALDLGREFLGRVADRLDAVAVQALKEICAVDDRDRVVVDLLHDLARRARRRQEAVPGGDV